MRPAQRNRRKAKQDTPDYSKVKRAMISAAIDLMAGGGFRRFRFEQLADKVGCNRATIYRYFDSKDDLTTEVMLALMQELTTDIIRETAGNRVTRETFTDVLHEIITRLRTHPRYSIAIDAENIETFARLTRQYFSEIATATLDKFLTDELSGPVMKPGISIGEAVDWLMHQIVSYGFLGISGATAEQQKAHLNKMVVSVILR